MTPSQQFEAWWKTAPQLGGTTIHIQKIWLAAYAAGREAGLEEAAMIAQTHHAAEAPDETLPAEIATAIRQARSQS